MKIKIITDFQLLLTFQNENGRLKKWTIFLKSFLLYFQIDDKLFSNAVTVM